MSRILVKGIKHGTLAQYKAIQHKDPDTLYIITDRGVIFRGESIVIPRTVVDADVSGEGAGQVATFTIQYYTAGQTGDNLPQTLKFSVRTSAAVEAVVGTLNQAINAHRTVDGSGTTADPYVYADGKATDASHGHVRLTDVVDMATAANNAAAAEGGTAVTPKGVYDAINSVLPGLAGAMQFKGTVSSVADMPGTYNVGEVYVAAAGFTFGDSVTTITVEAGDMLIATDARTVAGAAPDPRHWAVVEQNLTGAVTAQEALASGSLVVGLGNRAVRTLRTEGRGSYLRTGADGSLEWARHAIHYATCATAASEASKAASTDDGGTQLDILVPGTLVAVRFGEAANPIKASTTTAPVMLDVDNTGPHIVLHKKRGLQASSIDYADAPVVAGVIHAGDTALFVYDSSRKAIGGTTYSGVWRLLAVDHILAQVALTGLYGDLYGAPDALSDFENNVTAYGQCNTLASVAAKQVVLPSGSGFAAAEGSVLAVRFGNRLLPDASLTLGIQGDDASRAPINSPVALGNGADAIAQAGDVCVFVYGLPASGAATPTWNLVSIRRPIDGTVTAGSTNLVTSGAVAAAIANATGAAVNKRNFYGVCNTAASTAAKQAVGVTAFELNTGAVVTVKFTNAVIASGATLALSSDLGLSYTAAKYIYYDGQPLAADVIEAGDTCTFMYDGAQFNLIAFAREGLKWEALPEIVV